MPVRESQEGNRSETEQRAESNAATQLPFSNLLFRSVATHWAGLS